MKTTVDTFLSASGFSNATDGSDTAKGQELRKNVTDAQNKIAEYERKIADSITKSADWLRDSRNWMGLALQDLKERHQVDENLRRRDGGGKIKAGRTTRYQSRWDRWKSSELKSSNYRKQADGLKSALESQREVLKQAKDILAKYEQALAEKVAQGYSVNQASKEAELNIEQKEAEIDAIKQQSDAQAKAVLISEKQKLTKIVVVSGALVAIVLGVIIFRR